MIVALFDDSTAQALIDDVHDEATFVLVQPGDYQGLAVVLRGAERRGVRIWLALQPDQLAAARLLTRQPCPQELRALRRWLRKKSKKAA